MYIFPFIFSSVVRRTVVSIEAASLANLAVLVLRWAFVVCELHVRALLADDNPWADDVLSANRRHRSRNRFADYSRRKPPGSAKTKMENRAAKFCFFLLAFFHFCYNVFFCFFFNSFHSYHLPSTLRRHRCLEETSWMLVGNVRVGKLHSLCVYIFYSAVALMEIFVECIPYPFFLFHVRNPSRQQRLSLSIYIVFL